jgi:hypothetical protein
MPRAPFPRLSAALACGLLLCAACQHKQAEEKPAEAQMDTTDTDVDNGVSSRQLEESAKPMTPEQAAAAGVEVDTTIRPDAPEVSDSTGSPAAATEPSTPPASGSPAAKAAAARDTIRH